MKHARTDANYAILTKQVKLQHETKLALNLLSMKSIGFEYHVIYNYLQKQRGIQTLRSHSVTLPFCFRRAGDSWWWGSLTMVPTDAYCQSTIPQKQFIIIIIIIEGGGLNLQPNFQKGGGGLTGPQLLEGGSWERGGDFFQRGCNFHIKN